MATPRPAMAILAPPSMPLLSLNGTRGHTPRSNQIANGQREVVQSEGRTARADAGATPRAAEELHGSPLKGDHVEGRADLDGRMTPVASDSGRISHSGSSDPSHPDDNSANSTWVSTASHPSHPSQQSQYNSTLAVPASVGLCTLATENQLKDSLLGKDRIFLLVLGKEIEGFVASAVNGHQTTATPEATSTSMLAALGPSFVVTAAATSKFQRMLVYKAAEWYGLKAAPGPDGTMIIGVLDSLDEKALCGLVPKPPSPKQNFRIMQRAAAANVSRTSGTMGDESGQDSAASRYRTLEEKQADYELARQRIYGDIMKDGSGPLDEQGPADGEEARGRTARRHEEEPDPVPQHIYESAGVIPAVFQPVYPSLYHPPKSDQHSQAASLSEDHSSSSNFAFAPNGNHYPAYPQMPPMQSLGGYPNGAQMSNGYTSNSQLGQPQYLVQQSYGGPSLHSHSTYMGQPVNNFGQTWQEGPPSEAYPAMMPPNQPANLMPGQLAMYAMPMPGQGWAYQSGMQQMTGHGYPMPMIPQGMQPYQPIYQYPIQQGMYPNLVQPTPMRPNPYPHSSSASSISSRSYHDHSRPHSRGSTTSTRSAASSVRLGAMYPAGHPPSYRQKGLKGQSFNGMTSFGLGERRSTRGHSPSSATSASSRSSRRAASIILNPPQQHQLPQRPDWAANNVPYHPSPMPSQPLRTPEPSTTDFPPLLRNGTNAEPMQVERAKARPSGTVWNGTAVKAQQQVQVISPANGAPPSPRPAMISPAPTGPPSTPPIADTSNTSIATESDPDFPRRIPSSRTAPTLFDPSAPQPLSRASSVNGDRPATSLSSSGMTSDELIEAKLAAVSLNAGVSIGPPSGKAILGAPSYAKIVRRD